MCKSGKVFRNVFKGYENRLFTETGGNDILNYLANYINLHRLFAKITSVCPNFRTNQRNVHRQCMFRAKKTDSLQE